MTSERWLLIIIIENKTIYAIAFFQRNSTCVFLSLFSDRIIWILCKLDENTPIPLKTIFWNHTNIKVWITMSTTGSLRMYTEMSYIFDAEYTRLIDHH